ncbi:hypothetical protein [Gordonia aichiensis]|uniref:hypothetical protein n=1 Tax=Gordonia aichiensis TaxID=36820 RepID=UPI00034546EC|nr:hypothetical protein [Gordonia aichiensis]
MSTATTTAHTGDVVGRSGAPGTDEPTPLIASARSGSVIFALLATSTTVTFGALFFV